MKPNLSKLVKLNNNNSIHGFDVEYGLGIITTVAGEKKNAGKIYSICLYDCQ